MGRLNCRGSCKHLSLFLCALDGILQVVISVAEQGVELTGKN